ncbi:LysR substrate-binding domain-containing protein [Pseudogemmobacter humi]|uniref:LysR substrate binding domain protein n=1 Tax=Pseudogemmobacter humi TaxID=2483812 RepID=A0A3P5X9Q3_9RHOB|nr:LysR substrate-binding domain-containing protein [Pseudogemmobacter humi]VDC31228.1 LysR substrate binding domain protein [Pseudogemmobacter humi]
MPGVRRDFPHMRLFVQENRGERRLRQSSEGVHHALLLPDKQAAPGLVSRRRITRFCEENGALHARDHERATPDTLRRMVAAGMVASLLPARCVRSEVMRGQLVTARAPARRGAALADSLAPGRNGTTI